MLMQQDRAAPAHGQDGLSAPFPNRTQLLSLAFVPSVPHVKKYSLMLCEVFLGGPGCLNDKHSTKRPNPYRSSDAAEIQLVLRSRVVETNPAMTNVGGDVSQHSHAVEKTASFATAL